MISLRIFTSNPSPLASANTSFFCSFNSCSSGSRFSIRSTMKVEIRAKRARGEKLDSEIPSSLMRCPCGESFDSHDPEGSYVHRRHIYMRDRDNEIRRAERLH